MNEKFSKNYTVAIDTIPLPEKAPEKIEFIMESISPVINQIIRDAMSLAIGSWLTPEMHRK